MQLASCPTWGISQTTFLSVAALGHDEDTATDRQSVLSGLWDISFLAKGSNQALAVTAPSLTTGPPGMSQR